MYRGKVRLEWDQTATLWLLHAAINTPKGKQQKRLHDIHPLYQDRPRPVSGENAAAATAAFKARLKAMTKAKPSGS